MKHVNEYNDNFKNKIDIYKKFQPSKLHHGMQRVVSVVDDILHLDFASLVHSFENREGFKKVVNLLSELSYLKMATDEEDFEDIDIVKYDIDISLIIELLEDSDVKRYLTVDKKVVKRMEKYEELINWLKEEEKK